MAETMQRWSMNALGRENLKLTQEPVPKPGPGEVRMRVNAVALNYRDKMVIEGMMPIPLSFPFTPASDMAGVVDSIGEGVTRFQPGARVISTFFPEWIDSRPQADARHLPYKTSGGYFPGMLAEYVIVNENGLVAAPETLDDVEASTLPCAGLTAWFALVERGNLRAGQSVLVQGTGGVAIFALQIAKALGAEVYVTSGSDEKLARAKKLGADRGINRLKGDWAEALLTLTQDRGIDHIIETVGGENLQHSLRAVAVHGRISVIGVLAGSEITLSAGELLLKSPVIQGIGVGHRRALEEFVRAVEVTGLKPVIEQRYRFDQLEQALEHLDRGAFGKIVLTRE
ncbi:TPA: NAD(P)-dependent alcohol dehydrogenase [Enterobacter cloacae]|uniref:zinc-dependent alcohol dehydrogenase family protein n=1 Tax=Enterobacter TaxID=547 RepID=UPI0015B625EF|nr:MULTISPECIES: NAD(P)-dependent alcohol dehydrogenase [Enterobacter]HAS0831272.1 NAD(P)-dependent alcohol dehydrogenase [Enterobacter cloacae subsp. cloacae]NWJ79045.1 NAD(P)-dependent alcohol dehydrogenase [Enterobacter sp. SECR19-1250]QUG50325.1 NAD(P)-dependent alcohol dehydrogenase [Enterobacter cloacae]HDS4821640.1 NAD(P)-dependent alcohol dehydrogenase [Enterobacter cloacae]HDT2258192.1 NAD(P)-dependent alcohol dehydrogenase [Enterobacter cloacae]